MASPDLPLMLLQMLRRSYQGGTARSCQAAVALEEEEVAAGARSPAPTSGGVGDIGRLLLLPQGTPAPGATGPRLADPVSSLHLLLNGEAQLIDPWLSAASWALASPRTIPASGSSSQTQSLVRAEYGPAATAAADGTETATSAAATQLR